MFREAMSAIYVGKKGSRTTGVTVRVDGPPGWTVLGEFTDVDGRLALVRLTMAPDLGKWPQDNSFRAGQLSEEQQRGITARLLRRVSLGDLFGALPEALASIGEDWGRPQDKLLTAAADRWSKTKQQPGRAGRGDGYYALWAARYVENLDKHNPVAATAAEHGKTQGQVRDLLHEARRRKLLTKAGRGRAGGSLTEKCIEALAQAQDMETQSNGINETRP